MVMRRSDSKAGKGLSNLTEQHPKRTKVHAQRKFAQGSGMNSPSSSPLKGKEKAKANGGGSSSSELLPSKRPKAEDFLTFLCFRGTKALPPRLDFFNRAAESDKAENASVSSKSQSNQETKPKIKNIVGSKKKMIKDKEQTTATRIMDMKQKSKTVLRSRALIKKRQKVSKTEITRGKRKPSILKRMGRVRKGLRSAGELPPGSDEGIKTDRKPRTVKEKPQVKPKEKKEKKTENEEEDVSVRKSFRSKKSPQNKNVKVRPSRKTKEAAALYMEIINDEELEEEKNPKKEAPEKAKPKKKGVAMKVTKKISQIHRSHKSILKRLGTSRMRSGLRSASEAENGKSKMLRSKKVLKKAVKKIDKGAESEQSDTPKGQRSCKKSKRGQYAGDESEIEESDVEISDRKTRQSSKPKGSKKVKIEESDVSEEDVAESEESEDEKMPKKITRRSSKVKVEPEASEESENDVKVDKKVKRRKAEEDSKSIKKTTRTSKVKAESEESEVDEKAEKKLTRGSKVKAENEAKEKAKTKLDSEDETKIDKRTKNKKEETDSDNADKRSRRNSRLKTKSEEREPEKKVTKRSLKDDVKKAETPKDESSDTEQKPEKKKRIIKSKNDAKDSDEEPEKKVPKRKTEEIEEAKNDSSVSKGAKRVAKAKVEETKESDGKTAKKTVKKSKSSESEDEETPKAKPAKRGRPAKLKLDIKEEPISDESSESESVPRNLGKRKTRQKGSLREHSTSESDYSSGEEVKMPFRMSTRKRHTPRAAAMKASPVSKRPSRKTKEAATIYMEMLTKDLRSPDEEESEFEELPSNDEDELKLKKERKSKSPESSKKERPSRVCRGKKSEYVEPKSSEESEFEEPKEPETQEVEEKEVKVEIEKEEEKEPDFQEEEERKRPKRPKLTARDPDDRPSSELDASRLARVRRRSDSEKKDIVPDTTVPTDDVVEALMSLRDHVPIVRVSEYPPQPQEENRLKPLSVQIFSEEIPKNMSIKKPSVNETWRQAFKNAKIPKPGHISPAPRAVEPFVRKPFFIKTEPKALPTPVLPKITPKSLTQLQYEKRSSDLISGLKETPVQKIEGKHLNLPLAVDTLRKMSPTTVTKKPVKTKPETSCSNLLHKKKVNMSTEEIKEWLNNCENDPKDCEMYENLSKEKVDRRVVEAPVRLKELDTKVYEQEMIAKCRVDDYKEKMSRVTDTPKKTPQKSYKSNESMTEEEMFEYDFRFDRNSVSSDDKSDTERKIFQQRRSGSISKRSSPTAFSAENESSVYAFEPDLPPPAAFRRRSRVSEESPTTSIAVQVNLENEKQEVKKENENLESSTQTDENDGQLFYFPFDDTGRQNIQGVAVKLQSDGPEQRVIMRAKLVTKPSDDSQPSSSRESPKRPQKPEQKVRPLTKPPVGTVQPTVRDSDGRKTQVNDRGTSMKQEDLKEKTNQSTQSSPNIEKVEEKDENIPTRSKSCKRSSISSNEFPIPGTSPCICEAPVFRPTEKEFQDPLEYIQQITPEAQSYGICKIIPPSNFKPECKVSDDMRFIAYNQYVHKMLNRWGPNVKEMSAIKKYLATQSITLNQLPWIGGMEIDLPRLYQTVQTCGGLKEVIEKKRWTKVADAMKIPKSAQDRVTKLDDIYCKYLLPYDTLSHEERSKLLNDVELEWSVHEKRILEDRDDEKDKEDEESEDDSDDRDECITKGRSMALSQFFRIARNTMSMWFKDANPSAKEVETEFWKHVTAGVSHLCVHSGSIDSGSWGYGFPTSKTSPTSRHPWNLKVLTNNNGSILRSLGPAIGVTVPTLHVGMLFSACCWYRDPHSLPWIEYLHTGASKIWYGVPDSWCEELRAAVKKLLPGYCRDRKIWLASDTAMVPPELLVENGVSLCRTVQEPGQFILVFPKAFTSSICTGYSLSESVYFAQPSWLNTARLVFKDIQDSCEPPIFSLEKLLFNIASDVRSSPDVLNRVIPMIADLKENEIEKRKKLEELGLKDSERLNVSKGRKKSQEDVEEYECEVCNVILFLSLVSNSEDDCNYCLDHAIETLTKDKTLLKHCKLMLSYDEDEMDEVMDKARARVEQKTVKKQVKNSTSK